MTVTLDSGRTTFTITSSLITTPWSGISAVTLTVKKGCDTTKVFTIEEADTNASGEYSFTTTDAGFAFDQEVYSFTLKVTTASGINYEYYCYFVDVDLTCRVRSVVANEDYSKEDKMYIMLLHYQLTKDSLCHKSSCSDYCMIFNELDNELSMLKC